MNNIIKGFIIIIAFTFLCSCATTSTANLQGFDESINTTQTDCLAGTEQHDTSSESNSEEVAPPPVAEELGNILKKIKEFFGDDVLGVVTGWLAGGGIWP